MHALEKQTKKKIKKKIKGDGTERAACKLLRCALLPFVVLAVCCAMQDDALTRLDPAANCDSLANIRLPGGIQVSDVDAVRHAVGGAW